MSSLKQTNPFKYMDSSLSKYYQSLKDESFFESKEQWHDDQTAKGKFTIYCETNGVEFEQVHEEFVDSTAADSLFVDFDEAFPFHPLATTNTEEQTQTEIYRVLKHCWDLGKPPNCFPTGGYVVASRMDPIARVLLCAVYDEDHPFSVFVGMRYLIQAIWKLVNEFNQHHFSPFIESQNDAFLPRDLTNFTSQFSAQIGMSTAFTAIEYYPASTVCRYAYVGGSTAVDWKALEFPPPLQEEININMMPLEMDAAILEQQLPAKLHGYLPWIRACLESDHTQQKQICFLTIQESFVKKGRTQRRPGLHVEVPGTLINVQRNGGASWFSGWGGGYAQRDGIYMASNVSSSCAVWNCRIVERKSCPSAIGALGEIGYLRGALGKQQRYELEGNKLYWITDRTPHEALPMEQDGWRQFFRLVSRSLGVWYEQHSTPNPLGIMPNEKRTKIITSNKFVTH